MDSKNTVKSSSSRRMGLYLDTPPPSYNTLCLELIEENQKQCTDENSSTSFETDQTKNIEEKEEISEEISTVLDEEASGLESGWVKFAKRTSLHGLKIYRMQYSESKSFSIRKIVWLGCLVMCSVIFYYQALGRIRQYHKYKSNSNMDVKYVDTLPFPCVTICNQNVYRLTETVHTGMYEFIKQHYSQIETMRMSVGMNGLGDRMAPVSCPAINQSEFFTTTAHQKLDFIEKCTWLGEDCIISQDFQTTMTDMGVCYTFNAPGSPKSPISVNQSDQNKKYQYSAGFALKLKLNIEQYEYMTELPYEQVGIKVLLHAPHEVPLVKDLGFAVAPGTQTLVAVKRVIIDNLEAPYGACVKRAEPRSVCMMRCEAEFISNLCKCVDHYMPRVNGVPECKVTTAFQCSRTALALGRDTLFSCDCPAPCYREVYEAQLSYAVLAALDVQKLAEVAQFKFELMSERYSYAKEVSSKVRAEIADNDRKLIEQVKKAKEECESALEKSFIALEDDDVFHGLYGTSHQLIDFGGQYIEDLLNLITDYHQKQEASVVVHPIIPNYKMIVNQLSRYINAQDYYYESKKPATGKSTTRRKLEACSAVERDSGLPPEILITWANYTQCDERGPITGFFFSLRMYIQLAHKFALLSLIEVENIVKTYQEFGRYLYANSSIDYVENVSYIRCIGTMNTSRLTLLPSLRSLLGNLNDYLASNFNFTKKVEIHGLLEEFYKIETSYKGLTEDKYFTVCNWWAVPSWKLSQAGEYQMLVAYQEAARVAYLDIIGQRESVALRGRSVLKMFREKFNAMIELFDLFLNRNITKLELSKILTSKQTTDDLQALQIDIEQYYLEYNQFIFKIFDVETKITQSYSWAFRLTPPVMNSSNIELQRIVQYAREHHHTDRIIAQHLDKLHVLRNESLIGLVVRLYGRYRLAVMQEKQSIETASVVLDSKMKSLRDELVNYAQASRIGDTFYKDNFIKLEIFYKDMSYERIIQQVSLDELGVISEIGSLMGLLLGASVLTACELLDMIALQIISKFSALWKKRNSAKFNISQ